MKVSAIISGMKIREPGAKSGVRSPAEIQPDIEDVESLIYQCKLRRDFPQGDEQVQNRYEQIFDNVFMRSD